MGLSKERFRRFRPPKIANDLQQTPHRNNLLVADANALNIEHILAAVALVDCGYGFGSLACDHERALCSYIRELAFGFWS